MSQQEYNGVTVEDVWGKTYLISDCPFARAGLGDDYLSQLQDPLFGRSFLHKLQPEWQQDAIWRKLYLQAKPWCQQLQHLSSPELAQEVLELFQTDRLRAWQLTDGWASPPAGSPGEGGLVPLAGSGAAKSNNQTANGTKAGKARKATPADTTGAGKAQAAGHESKAAAPASSPKEPNSLAEAVSMLAARRQQIATQGYQQKYTDAELAAKAQQGDVNDRFLIRLIDNNPDKASEGRLGFRRPSGRAPYWATTFDMAEAADTDPELLAALFGIDNYDPSRSYTLAIIDTHKMPPKAERSSFIPTYDNMRGFAEQELTEKEGFNKPCLATILTPDFSEGYAGFMAAYASTGQDIHDRKAVREYALETIPEPERRTLNRARHVLQEEFGANPLFSGDGMTKVNQNNRYAKDIGQKSGVVESFTFERDPLTIGELQALGAVTLIPALPLKA
ncbi:hypothetical protein LZP73_13400 [Shewanella sp. AS16]|uniref:hypothetical protein n=1 Tax=Shewanella sp. AS16 TaxID=2907625 RepID=UPI001F26DF8C|nr:hypothetical protein [Shewanella sp. AS16]MCE9687188.1 hypothetical protein [Shewanella sp. AS16]